VLGNVRLPRLICSGVLICLQDNVILKTTSEGRLSIRDQVADYMYWGKDLAHFSVFESFADTYEDTKASDTDVDHLPEQAVGPGWPRSFRVAHLDAHPDSSADGFPAATTQMCTTSTVHQ
jgi:hypothetical protein